MKNILILNLHQRYKGFAEGKLTNTLIEEAETFLGERGFILKKTVAEKGYTKEEELEKFKWADAFFIQSPVYWMGLPWVGKKYIDEIFSAGQGSVTYESDGRSATDPTKPYGSGGLMKEKRYMLSFTYNCPLSEFDNPNGFYEGMDIDEANIALHKAFQFCGAKKLASYSMHDVHKNHLDIEAEKAKLRETLTQNFCC